MLKPVFRARIEFNSDSDPAFQVNAALVAEVDPNADPDPDREPDRDTDTGY